MEKNSGLHVIKPYQIPVTLDYEPSITIQVSVYNFTHQLLLLLLDEELFGNPSNLDIDYNNYFGKYQSPNNFINCIHSGKWYQNAHQYLCKLSNDFLVGIIFSSDQSTFADGKK